MQGGPSTLNTQTRCLACFSSSSSSSYGSSNQDTSSGSPLSAQASRLSVSQTLERFAISGCILPILAAQLASKPKTCRSLPRLGGPDDSPHDPRPLVSTVARSWNSFHCRCTTAELPPVGNASELAGQTRTRHTFCTATPVKLRLPANPCSHSLCLHASTTHSTQGVQRLFLNLGFEDRSRQILLFETSFSTLVLKIGRSPAALLVQPCCPLAPATVPAAPFQ